VIVLSLLLVIAAAVCLFIGLFVVTESLTFIVAAIVLCVLSLLLLWLGTRAHKKRAATTATVPSPAPVYGGGARPGARVAAPTGPVGGVAPPVRAPERDADDTMVVRKTDARDRAAARVASVVEDDVVAAAEPAAAAPAAAPVVKKAVVKKAAAAAPPAKKASTKKASTKKASTRKVASKKASTKKASTKKAASKKAATKKAATKKTTGAAAKARLADISGLGPAKQDALLKAFGNLEAIQGASAEDLAQVKGVGDALAKRIKDGLS
jgi:hypothetical protein